MTSMTKTILNHLKFFILSTFFLSVEAMDFWVKAGIRPFLFITLVYISLIYSLPFLNVFSLLVFGFLKDGYYDYPLGYSNCQFIVLYLFLIRQKKTQLLSNLAASWGYFSIFLVIACGLQIAGLFYLGYHPIPITHLMCDGLITLSLFPLMAKGIFWLTYKTSSPPLCELK